MEEINLPDEHSANGIIVERYGVRAFRLEHVSVGFFLYYVNDCVCKFVRSKGKVSHAHTHELLEMFKFTVLINALATHLIGTDYTVRNVLCTSEGCQR